MEVDGDSGSDEVSHVSAETRATMCLLQQQIPSYQDSHVSGTDVNIQTTYSGMRATPLLVDNLGQDIDFEESRVKIQIDFTEYLVKLQASNPLVQIYDYQPDDAVTMPMADGNYANYRDMNVADRIIPMIDMNVCDHMWSGKKFAMGRNNGVIMSYAKLDLLLQCERKRSGEEVLGRTALSTMNKMYPLMIENVSHYMYDIADAKKCFWLQTYDGRLMKRLSIGSVGGKCVETFTIPLKWFTEGAFGRIETPLPDRFSFVITCTAGCYGEIVRWGRLPGADMFATFPFKIPDPTTNADPLVKAIVDPLSYRKFDVTIPPTTDPSEFGLGRPSATTYAWNVDNTAVKHLVTVDIPNRLFYAGEIGRPIEELTQAFGVNNPFQDPNATIPEHQIDIPKEVLECFTMPISATVMFSFKAKTPTSEVKGYQSLFYSDSIDNTTTLRPQLVKVNVSKGTITPDDGGEYMFTPAGEVKVQQMQLDTADYYKILVVEDSPVGMDKFPSGMGQIKSSAAWNKYMDSIHNSLWRIGPAYVNVFQRLKWQFTTRTNRTQGVMNNRTEEISLTHIDDWFYKTADFISNYEIPCRAISGYQTRSQYSNTIPIRRFLPSALVSAQADDSLKTLNGQPPSKPRGAHLISFWGYIDDRLQPPPSVGEIDQSKPGATLQSPGYKIYIISHTTESVFLNQDGTVTVNATEENV